MYLFECDKKNKKRLKRALVCGGGGLIGNHLVKQLKARHYFAGTVDLKHPVFGKSPADEFIIGDLRKASVCKKVFDQPFDEVYHLAASVLKRINLIGQKIIQINL